jgi:hypothetical protein
MGSALATIAVLAPVGLAAHAILRGDARLASSHAHNRSAFKIRGNVVRPLRPGSMRRLNLKLTNRTNHGLLVTRITVQVKLDTAHRKAGCSRARSYRFIRMRHREYPLHLPARRTRSLRALGVRRVPRLRMLSLPTNQDACKGAKLRLRYLGRATPRRASHLP